MNPTTITARITDQRLQLVNEPLIASGAVGVVQIRFEFCGLWDGCGRTAVFYRDPATVYHVPVVDSLVTVPPEVLAEEGDFYFGVAGVYECGSVRPTEVIKVKVARGAITTSTATPEDPAPDIYDQLLAAYGKMEKDLADTYAEMEKDLDEAYDKMLEDTTLMHARLDEAIAMRSAECAVKYTLDADNIEGSILSNGATAVGSFLFSVPGTWYPGDKQYIELPVCLAPMQPVEFKQASEIQQDHLLATIYTDVDGDVSQPGSVVLCMEATIDAMGGISGALWFDIPEYPLANVSIRELADLRVGADGTVYDTAGEAVREQIKNAGGSATVPPATSEEYGTVKVADDEDMASITTGIYPDKSTGMLSIIPANNYQIDGRWGNCTVITPQNLEYAVKSVGDNYYAKAEDVGDVEAALDSILAMQEALIGGGAE